MHRLIFVIAIAMTSPGQAQTKAVITNGSVPFAEGFLWGYEVQASGRSLCRDPQVYGRYIICGGKSSQRVWVDTNGVLGAYIVVDRDGREICSDPMVWNEFRGPMSYIICE